MYIKGLHSFLIKQLLFLFFAINITTQLSPLKIESPQPAATKDESITNNSKKWNFLAYFAANNNLYRCAKTNIKQMEKFGSNNNVNLFLQLDNFGQKEVSYYKVKKGETQLLKTIKNQPESLSGTSENLFGFVEYITKNYPAEHTALILWNHGSGIKDPFLWSKALPQYRDECFVYNQSTKKYEIKQDFFRGIAFNDIGHTYLNNQDLKNTLEKITTTLLSGKKIDIVGMDACHMAMAEICTQIRPFASYLVASEEIEPGLGWDYSEVLSPFNTTNMSPEELAKHIVTAYGKQYNNSFSGLTQSAIDLTKYEPLEQNINIASSLLLKLIKEINSVDFFNLLDGIRRSNKATIAFLDTDYIDLLHFYKNLNASLQDYNTNNLEEKECIEQLKRTLQEGQILLAKSVINNTAGKGIQNAGGIAIYLPTKSLHSSYLETEFAKTTNWCNFIYAYLQRKKRNIVEKINKEIKNNETTDKQTKNI